MVHPGKTASGLGFAFEDVKSLCKKHNMDLCEMVSWYDGYQIGRASRIFNPYSVMLAIDYEYFGSYWTTTVSFDSIVCYIQMNFDGLKDDIARMLAGEHVYVDTNRFLNYIHILRCKDDVLTVLIHLGYLTYDEDSEECYIPNKEVKDLLINAYKYAF